MRSTILKRSGQYVAAAALMTGVMFASVATASANESDMAACVKKGGKTYASCCIDSGGRYVSDPAQNVQICDFGSAWPLVHDEPPTGQPKPTVHSAGVPNPGQSQPPSQPKKPTVPRADVSNPGQAQPSSPSDSGIA